MPQGVQGIRVPRISLRYRRWPMPQHASLSLFGLAVLVSALGGCSCLPAAAPASAGRVGRTTSCKNVYQEYPTYSLPRIDIQALNPKPSTVKEGPLKNPRLSSYNLPAKSWLCRSRPGCCPAVGGARTHGGKRSPKVCLRGKGLGLGCRVQGVG